MSKLHSIIAPELTDANFGDNIKEQFGNINDNFQKLSNYDFTKGEKGDSIEIVDVKLNEDKDLKNKIYKTLLNYRSDYVDDKYDEGDDVKFREAVNYNVRSYLDHEDSTFKYIVQNGEKIGSLPFVYIDERFHHKGISNDVKNTQIYDNEVDLSCIIMYNNGILEVVRNFPNLYYDEDVKALCWEWLGCKTGVAAAGPMGPNGVNTSLLLVKIGAPKEEIETCECQEIIVNGMICKTISELKAVFGDKYADLHGWQAIVIPVDSADKIYITPIQYKKPESEINNGTPISELFTVVVSDYNKVDLGFNTDKFWQTIIDEPLKKKGFVLPADALDKPEDWHILHSDSSNNLILKKTKINKGSNTYEVGTDAEYGDNNLVIHYNTTIKASDGDVTTVFNENGINVTGNIKVSKTLDAATLTAANESGTGQLTVDNATINKALTAANATINNDLTVDGNTTINETLTSKHATIDNATINIGLTVDGDATINKTLYTKDATINNDLTVTNNAEVDNDLTVDGNATVNGTLTAPTLNTNTLTATNEDKTGQLTVDNATVNGTLAATTLTATNEDKTGQLTVDNATVNGTLTVDNATFDSLKVNNSQKGQILMANGDITSKTPIKLTCNSNVIDSTYNETSNQFNVDISSLFKPTQKHMSLAYILSYDDNGGKSPGYALLSYERQLNMVNATIIFSLYGPAPYWKGEVGPAGYHGFAQLTEKANVIPENYDYTKYSDMTKGGTLNIPTEDSDGNTQNIVFSKNSGKITSKPTVYTLKKLGWPVPVNDTFIPIYLTIARNESGENSQPFVSLVYKRDGTLHLHSYYLMGVFKNTNNRVKNLVARFSYICQ